MKVISGRNTSNKIANKALIHKSGHTTLFESTVYRNNQVQQINGNQYINLSKVHALKSVSPDRMNFFMDNRTGARFKTQEQNIFHKTVIQFAKVWLKRIWKIMKMNQKKKDGKH